MKKAFDQTVCDLKRKVNKKVLKIPEIEQKVLDATSNEPCDPPCTLLADIAQASRNYDERHMIMKIIWKRINDTGGNWLRVHKALAVLEYMVANGSERVIHDIRECAYQIQALNGFQYIDSSGRDQGNDVRRRAQSLVVLVNDEERIEEARQKAAANRDEFRSMSSSGGMYRLGVSSQGFEDPFGDSPPFKAASSTENIPTQPQPAPAPSFPSNTNPVTEQGQWEYLQKKKCPILTTKSVSLDQLILYLKIQLLLLLILPLVCHLNHFLLQESLL